MVDSIYRKVLREDLHYVFDSISDIKEKLKSLRHKPVSIIYSNKEVKALLGVSDKLLQKYRDDGVLTYRRCDDKYWYTQDDIERFINLNSYDAFAS